MPATQKLRDNKYNQFEIKTKRFIIALNGQVKTEPLGI